MICHLFVVFFVHLEYCQDLPLVENGQLTISDFANFGFVVIIVCNPGFKLQGNSTMLCQSNRTWSQPGRCVATNVTSNFQCFSSLNTTVASLFPLVNSLSF